MPRSTPGSVGRPCPTLPPASAVGRWRSTLDQAEVLPQEEALRIAALSPLQLDRLSLRIPEASPAGSPWMRFSAGLTPAEVRAARSESGLSFQAVALPRRRVLFRRTELSDGAINPALEQSPASFRIRDHGVPEPGEAAAAEVPGLLFSLDPVSERPGPSIRTNLLLPLPHRRPSSPAPPPGE